MWSGIEVTVWSGVVGYRGDCTGPLFGQVWSGIEVTGGQVWSGIGVTVGQVWSGTEVTVWSGVVGYRGDCLVRCGWA